MAMIDLQPDSALAPNIEKTGRRARLRAATHGQHVATEAFVDAAGFFASEGGLRAYLKAQARINAGLEAACAARANRLLPDWSARHKVASLVADLDQWGDALPPALAAAAFSYIDDDAALFGALYVLEGSTLGGMVFAKRLKDNDILKNGHRCRFLTVYGRDTAAMWHRFVDCLDAAMIDDAGEARVHAAADRTFALVRETLADQMAPAH